MVHVKTKSERPSPRIPSAWNTVSTVSYLPFSKNLNSKLEKVTKMTFKFRLDGHLLHSGSCSNIQWPQKPLCPMSSTIKNCRCSFCEPVWIQRNNLAPSQSHHRVPLSIWCTAPTKHPLWPGYHPLNWVLARAGPSRGVFTTKWYVLTLTSEKYGFPWIQN